MLTRMNWSNWLVRPDTNTRTARRQPDRQRLKVECLEERTLLCNLGPGSLDESFSSDGKVTTAVGPGWAQARDVAIQSDGKIVVAGAAVRFANGSLGSPEQFAVTRYNSDGTLDTTFDGDGKVTTIITAGNKNSGATDIPWGVSIQTDGKIVVAGMTTNGKGNYDFAVVRYNTNGSLDASFGTGGKVTTSFSSSFEDVRDVIIQPDGKIIVAGSAVVGTNYAFAIARYNASGSLDTSFGSGGKVTTNITSQDDQVHAVTLQSDGDIVVAGVAGENTSRLYALARYNSNGSLDGAFGTGGIVTTAIGPSAGNQDFYFDVSAQSDGKVVAVGRDFDLGAVITRYNSDGTLDTSFDGDGIQTFDVGTQSTRAEDVAIQSDGRIIVTGSSGGPTGDFLVARLNSDGSFDSGFGSDGITLTDFAGNSDGAFAAAIQSDGHIVAVGGAIDATNNRFAVARYCA
jgi:uncharacterized delta-60 repeat protein